MRPLQQPFQLEKQVGERLCWAAVSVSLLRYYQINKSMNQESLARDIFGEKYDRFCDPMKAFERVGLTYRYNPYPLIKDKIAIELQQNNLVIPCMKYFVGWHLVVIHGIDTNNLLTISDSMFGNSRLSVENFTHAYQKHHVWESTFTIFRPK